MAPKSEDQKHLVDDDTEKPGNIQIKRQESWLGMRKRKIVVEPFLVLYVAAGFPMMTIRSQFMYQKVGQYMGIDTNNLTEANSTNHCGVNRSDPDYILRESVQAENTRWNIYCSLVGFIPGIVTLFIFGSLSDRFGRRFVLILPCIGSTLSAITYMLMVYFDLPIYFFLVAEALEYIFGGMSTLFMGAFAYIADTVPGENRTFRMTVLDVISLGNGAIANLFVGYWIKAQGFFWPLVFVVVGKFLALLYGVFFIPETIVKVPERRKMNCSAVLGGVRAVIKEDGTGRRWRIGMLLAVYTVPELISGFSIKTLYEMNAPLCWGPVLLSYYGSVALFIQCLAMLLAAAFLRKYFPDIWLVLISKVSVILEYGLMAFATTTTIMFITPVVGCLSFLAIPLIRSLLSRQVSADEMGSVLSMMSILFQCCSVLNSTTTNMLYAATLYFMEGFVFLITASLNVIAVFIILLYIYLDKRFPKGLHAKDVSVSVHS